MGRTVGRCFHINHEVFIGHRLRKKRSDSDFSVQELSDATIYGCEPTELPGIFPEEEVWRLLSIIAENNCLKEESQLLPNHHIVPILIYIIAELESQLLPNGNARDGVGDGWVELESQLLPNRHIMHMAKYSTSKLESQLLPNWLIWYGVHVSQSIFWELLPKHLLTRKMMLKIIPIQRGKSQLLSNQLAIRNTMLQEAYIQSRTSGSCKVIAFIGVSGWITTLFRRNVLEFPLSSELEDDLRNSQRALSLLRKLGTILQEFQLMKPMAGACTCDLMAMTPSVKYPLLLC